MESTPPAPDWAEIYRDSRYAIADGDGWVQFTLRGSLPTVPGTEVPRTLVTAWNPNSEERSAEWNRAANRRLEQALGAAGWRFAPAWGASLPGVEPAWKEPGFVVDGWDPSTAARWGRDWGQRAVVWFDANECILLFCRDQRIVPCQVTVIHEEPA